MPNLSEQTHDLLKILSRTNFMTSKLSESEKKELSGLKYSDLLSYGFTLQEVNSIYQNLKMLNNNHKHQKSSYSLVENLDPNKEFALDIYGSGKLNLKPVKMNKLDLEEMPVQAGFSGLGDSCGCGDEECEGDCGCDMESEACEECGWNPCECVEEHEENEDHEENEEHEDNCGCCENCGDCECFNCLNDHDNKEHLKEVFGMLIVYLRAMQLWFHSAHHSIKGVSFTADHADLLAEFYKKAEEEFDQIAEKSVGKLLTTQLCSPSFFLSASQILFEHWKDPTTTSTEEILQEALNIELCYQDVVKVCFDRIAEDTSLLGLNDFLTGTANDHDTHVYKLFQRVGK